MGLGSCIDCGLCVQVCPTGIDIRDGLQSDCIGCAACIDVCDGVMDKMRYPRGLIRYATQNGVAQKLTRAEMLRRVARPRVLIYGAVLLAVGGAVVTSLVLRSPYKVDVVRDRASLARMVEDGRIENVYRLQVMNATERLQHYRVAVDGLPEVRISGATQVDVESAQARWFAVAAWLRACSAGACDSAAVLRAASAAVGVVTTGSAPRKATTEVTMPASTTMAGPAITSHSTFTRHHGRVGEVPLSIRDGALMGSSNGDDAP